VSLIDAIKIEWIDILLRQMVILVGFLGAMLATQRKKHINIDAASKLLPQSARRVSALVVNAVTVLVCVVLAFAGAEMVKFSLAFPKELLPWADEWSFQLLFPIGFGLLAVHFVVRVLEDIERLRTGAPMPLEGEAAQAAMHKEGRT
jgi:TRAP-type C4-dicarboxylate transport system permease small subunit